MATETKPKAKSLGLFQLPAEWQAFSDLLDECGDELTEEQSAAFDAMQAKLLDQEGAGLDYYLDLIDARKFHAAMAKEREEIYKKQRTADENAVERTRNFLKFVLTQADRIIAKSDTAPARKIETPKGRTISIQNGGGPQPFDLIDGEEIPGEYLIPQPAKVDNEKIRADLKAGKALAFVRTRDREKVLIVK